MSKKSYNPQPKTRERIRTFLFRIKKNERSGILETMADSTKAVGVSHTVGTVMRDMNLIEDIKSPSGPNRYKVRFQHIDENLVSLIHLRLGQYNRDKALYAAEKEKPDFVVAQQSQQEPVPEIIKPDKQTQQPQQTLFPDMFQSVATVLPQGKQLYVVKTLSDEIFLEIDWINRKIFRFHGGPREISI